MGIRNKHKAFTLVEVLSGAVIVALTALAAWFAVAVLMKASVSSQNRSTAVNLLQKSQEEVRRYARSQYDGVDACVFPPAGGDACGFDDITVPDRFPEYQGFTRTLIVTREEGSELKKSTVLVRWTENGTPRQMSSVVLIARPPDTLPGNIIGQVRNAETGDLVGGVSVSARKAATSEIHLATSRSTLDPEKSANFDFAQDGHFVMSTGPWELQASASGFFPYVHPVPVHVYSNEETRVEVLLLEPLPEPKEGYIEARTRDVLSGAYLTSFSHGMIRLYEDGVRQGSVTSRPQTTFTITFTDDEERCLTVLTDRAYRAGWAGPEPSCDPAIRFEPAGWSSARYQSDGTVTCSFPWQGSAAADRICLKPEETKAVDIPLVPVPTATVKGRVVDSVRGLGFPNARVYFYWPAQTGGSRWSQVSTDAQGRFSASVPAVQEMFAGGAPAQTYLQVRARGTGPVVGCCHSMSTETRYSPRIYAGPLYEGNVLDVGDLVIPTQSREIGCGNVQGTVVNDKTTLNLQGVQVDVAGQRPVTDGSGYYLIECPPDRNEFFRLPEGAYNFMAGKTGFYENESSGNTWYQRRSQVAVQTDRKTTYDARLWPQGQGNLEVTVIDKSTRMPIEGVRPRLRLYTGTAYGPGAAYETGADGRVLFEGILETWPPPALPDDGYYRLSEHSHSLTIDVDPLTYEPFAASVTGLSANETKSLTVELIRKGGL